jgi:hypothetical protein
MKKEYNSCDEVKSYFSYYTVPQIALLWCGVEPHELQEEMNRARPVAESTSLLRNVFRHPYISCMEPRCRVLQDAIDNSELPVGRDGGKSALIKDIGHVAYDRRTIIRADLKVWLAQNFPNDKPAFLFDDIERATHQAINADSFRALQADRDALKARIEKATEEFRKLRQELEAMTGERDSLRQMVDTMSKQNQAVSAVDLRSETTYLNIIGAMLDIVLGKSPAGQKHSIYDNQSAVISALLAYHDGKQGIASRTLEQKFADAKRSLSAS